MLSFRSGFASVVVTAGVVLLGSGCGDTERTKSTGIDKSIVSKGIDAQDFTGAAQETTNLMLSAPRVQDKLKSIQAKLPSDQRPLIYISRIKNDSGLKVNMVDYFVTPIESVLVNSGKVDSVSEDKKTRAAAAGADILNGTSPRPADLTLHGVVSKLSTSGNGTDQNVYTFQLRLSDAMTGQDIFIGLPRQFVKQTTR
jgi:PBP1b-binding outer membrane lipoprotein LpoB